MRVNYVVILIVAAMLAAMYLYAQEPQQQSQENVSREQIAELLDSLRGDWTMFNGRVGGTFLYNKNTGAVYKFWSKSEPDGDFDFGFQRAAMLNRPDQPLPNSF